MAYGTAPRKINGVWYTRTGRRLSDAGQRFWDNKAKQGVTDTRGHYKKAGVGATASARQPNETPKLEGPSRQQVAEHTYYRTHPKEAAKAERAARTAGITAAVNRQVTKKGLKQAGVYVPTNAAKFTTDTAQQIGSALYNIPAAGYYTGEAVTKDVGAARHGNLSFKNTRQLGKEMVRGTEEQFKHPIRNRGTLLVTALGAAGAVAGTGARLGAAGKAIGEARAVARATGEGRYVPSTAPRSPTAAAVKALARKPEPKPRSLSFGDLTVHPETSKAPLRAMVQHARDKRLMAQAEKNPGGRAETRLAGKVGKELATEQRYKEALTRAAPGALAKSAKRLTVPQETAIRVVAEGKSIDARIADHQAEIAATKSPKIKRQLGVKIKKLEAARPFVLPGEKPRIHPSLEGAYKLAGESAARRTEMLSAAGELTPEQIASRVQAPGKGIEGARFERQTLETTKPHFQQYLVGRRVKALDRNNIGTIQAVDTAKGTATVHFHNKQTQLKETVDLPLNQLQSPGTKKGALVYKPGAAPAQDFTGGEFRVPYPKRSGAKSLNAPAGYRGGTPRKPGSLTNAYTDYNRRTGNFKDRSSRLIAESELEAIRYTGVLRKRDQIRKAAKPEPLRNDWVAVRLDKLEHGKIPEEVKQVQDAMTNLQDALESGGISKEAEKVLGDRMEKLRQKVVLGTQPEFRDLLKTQPELAKLYQQGKIGWVPPQLLGEYAHQAVKLSGVIGRRPVNVLDAVNNSSRLAILYLKPAYAAPNFLGNLTLNLIQQGFAAPKNLAAAARVNANLSPLAAGRLDAVMGEGFIHAISGEGGGLGSKAVQGAAAVWSKGVDLPFRRASFLFEARRVLRAKGIKGDWQGIERLLTDPALEDQLMLAAKRANREIIDYSNLSNREREVVRRVIFFYPWVKGSTTYAGRLFAEHPVTAAVLTNAGAQARQETQKRFGGPGPSYLEGAFPVGGKIVNPNALSILGTPAQVVDTASGVVSGDAKESAKAANFFTPALNLGLAEGLRIDPRTGFAYRPSQSGLSIAQDQLIAPLPQESLARGVKGQTSPNAIMQPTPGQAVGRFFGGGLVPTNYSNENYLARGRQEKFAAMKPGQRVLTRANDYRDAWVTMGKQAGLLPKDATHLPPELHDAIQARVIRYSYYASKGIRSHAKDPDYQRKAFQADVELLTRRKLMGAAEGKRALEWSKTATKADLEAAREDFTRNEFQGDVLTDFRKDLKDRGFDPGDAFSPP